jgi:hypothetical protein
MDPAAYARAIAGTPGSTIPAPCAARLVPITSTDPDDVVTAVLSFDAQSAALRADVLAHRVGEHTLHFIIGGTTLFRHGIRVLPGPFHAASSGLP